MKFGNKQRWSLLIQLLGLACRAPTRRTTGHRSRSDIPQEDFSGNAGGEANRDSLRDVSGGHGPGASPGRRKRKRTGPSPGRSSPPVVLTLNAAVFYPSSSG